MRLICGLWMPQYHDTYHLCNIKNVVVQLCIEWVFGTLDAYVE